MISSMRCFLSICFILTMIVYPTKAEHRHLMQSSNTTARSNSSGNNPVPVENECLICLEKILDTPQQNKDNAAMKALFSNCHPKTMFQKAMMLVLVFQKGSTPPSSTPTHHAQRFHQDCVLEAFAKKGTNRDPTCPLCRADLTPTEKWKLSK
jgi:hypothetical protein